MPGDSILELGVRLGHYLSQRRLSNDPGQVFAAIDQVRDKDE